MRPGQKLHQQRKCPRCRERRRDDLIAAGGTAEGAVKLLTRMGAQIEAACFVIDLPDLGGRAKLEALGVPVRTLIGFEGH